MKHETVGAFAIAALAVMLVVSIYQFSKLTDELAESNQQILRASEQAVEITEKVIKDSDSCEIILNSWKGKEIYNIIDEDDVIVRTKITGLYDPSSRIYCVDPTKIKGREVWRTEAHEYLHYLVDNGTCFNMTCREHFCKEVG